jgi:macrolide-specific efflux system membrane fusion protein
MLIFSMGFRMFANSQLFLRGLTLAIGIGATLQVVEASDAIEGKLIADQRGHISAQMTGERSQRVKEMYVRVGDRVKQGDRLALLDTEQLEADRLIAQRSLEEAQASAEAAKSSVARAQLDYDRKAGLRDSQSPAFNRAAYEDAEIELRAAESGLRSTQSSVARRDAEVSRIDLELHLAEI